MPFRDKYTNFWFNDISSESMKVWLTNNKDLAFQATPNFNDTFVTPVAGQTRYLTNTTISSNEFSLKCIAIEVTMQEWRAIQNWLSPLVKGKLQFDFNDNTYFIAKVSKPIKGTSFVAGSGKDLIGDIYNIEFTVDFATVEDWAALGPQVTVPINGKYDDFTLATIKLLTDIPIQHIDLFNSFAVFTCTYNEIFNNYKQWSSSEWWKSILDPKAESTENISAALSGQFQKDMIKCLLTNLSNMNILTLSSAINNKYYLPCVYNESQSRNTKIPSFGDIKANEERDGYRVYLTEPTILNNKTIYLDKIFYEKIISKPENASFYDKINYFILDNSLTFKNEISDQINYENMHSDYIAYIQQQTFKDSKEEKDKKVMMFCQKKVQNDYDFMGDTPITENGVTFFGMNVMFTASSQDGYDSCPFYYIEKGDTLSVVNAGSYDSYPNIFGSLGQQTSISVFKNEDLLYKYDLSILNAALEFDGKTGFVTFNNTLAEGAYLTSNKHSTKVVNNSINNGIMAVNPGHPEIIKIRVFGTVESKIAAINGSNQNADVQSIGVTHIFFQPVGEFKYSRNNNFAALIFRKIMQEQGYDKGTYPLLNRKYLDSSVYGSNLIDYNFTTNGFITKTKVSNKIDMWVLTIPTTDYHFKYTKDIIDNSPYMYLSLCDCETISIDTDTSAASYITMQTRDTY